jgi:hypothetical protein
MKRMRPIQQIHSLCRLVHKDSLPSFLLPATGTHGWACACPASDDGDAQCERVDRR